MKLEDIVISGEYVEINERKIYKEVRTIQLNFNRQVASEVKLLVNSVEYTCANNLNTAMCDLSSLDTGEYEIKIFNNYIESDREELKYTVLKTEIENVAIDKIKMSIEEIRYENKYLIEGEKTNVEYVFNKEIKVYRCEEINETNNLVNIACSIKGNVLKLELEAKDEVEGKVVLTLLKTVVEDVMEYTMEEDSIEELTIFVGEKVKVIYESKEITYGDNYNLEEILKIKNMELLDGNYIASIVKENTLLDDNIFENSKILDVKEYKIRLNINQLNVNDVNVPIEVIEGTLKVKHKEIDVSCISVNPVREYNGLTLIEGLKLSCLGLNGELVNINYTSAEFTTKDVGTGKGYIISGLSSANTNYTLSEDSIIRINGIVSVKEIDVNCIQLNPNREYNGLATIEGLELECAGVNDETVTISHTKAEFTNKDAGINKEYRIEGLSVKGNNYVLSENNITRNNGVVTQVTIDVNCIQLNPNKEYNGLVEITGLDRMCWSK